LANIKRWTKSEEDFLKKNYSKIPNTELADKFGVTVIAIQRKLSRLGCIRQKQKKWNAAEEDFLRKNFMKMSDEELARSFDVTAISIRRKLHRLNLSRLQEKKKMQDKTSFRQKIINRISKKRKIRKETYADLYKISKEYKLFDKIYHEIWKKEGVVKKIITNDSSALKYMIVDFEDIGEKKLVMGLQA
jgi:Zn-dependent peptidase ImmA (M78 family)